MISVGATSLRRRPRRRKELIPRLRSKYGWCCRSNNRRKRQPKTDRIDLVPANPLGQAASATVGFWGGLFSWLLPCRRTTLPADVAREATVDSIAQAPPTATTPASPSGPASASASSSTAPSAAYAAVDAAAAAAGRLSFGVFVTAGFEYGSAAQEKNTHAEGERKIVDIQHVEANADEIADGDSIEDGGEAVMIPLIDEGDEVEAASFMPPAYRSMDDNALRKWEAKDILTRAVDAEIGGGTFASVVHGQAASGGAPVAIKILGRESDDFGSQDKYINREVQTLTLTALHPNIVDILGVLSTAVRTYMIMPLVKTDLARLIKAGLLGEEEAVEFSAQFLSALEFVHDKGIVHRDLKPANLLVTHDNQVLLADFGFAKALEEGEDGMTGLCGTKPYLSPEQVNGLPYGTSSDMWSAGVVIYELLHGRTAFCPDSSIDLGPISMGPGPPEEGDIRMRLDPYDKLERENIKAGVFEVDSSRVGVTGEDFLRKLIILDPTSRLSARTAGEHAWLGGREVAERRRAAVTATTKEKQEAAEAEKQERALVLRSRRRRRVVKKPVVTSSPAPVAEGGSTPTSTACATSDVRSRC